MLKVNYVPGLRSYPGYVYFIQNVRDYDATRIVFQYWSAYANPSTAAPTVPSSVPITPADLPSRLAPNGSVPADVADEMDDLIKNNPSIVTSAPGATAVGTADAENQGKLVPPFVPVLPDGATTTPPGVVTGLGAQTLADAQARLAAAEQALAEAKAAADADPLSQPLQQAVTQAQTAVANATQAVSNADEKASESYNTPQNRLSDCLIFLNGLNF